MGRRLLWLSSRGGRVRENIPEEGKAGRSAVEAEKESVSGSNLAAVLRDKKQSLTASSSFELKGGVEQEKWEGEESEKKVRHDREW